MVEGATHWFGKFAKLNRKVDYGDCCGFGISKCCWLVGWLTGAGCV